MNKTALATIGALFGAIAFAAPAKAFVYLDGGVAGVAPSGSTDKNDLFPGLYGGGPYPSDTQPGFYFGDLSNTTTPAVTLGALKLSSTSIVTFTYLGKEAGWTNSFQIDTGAGYTPIASTAGKPTGVSITPIGSYTFSAGVIPFLFLTTAGGTGMAENGGAAVGGFASQSSIFLTFLDAAGKPTTASSGNVVDVFFDDSGAFNDDNHDDMGIRITVTEVPVPAALPIIAAAFAGFGFAGFRSRRPVA